MRTFVAGVFGGFVAFAASCATLLALSRPALPSGAAQGPTPAADAPEVMKAAIAPTAEVVGPAPQAAPDPAPSPKAPSAVVAAPLPAEEAAVTVEPVAPAVANAVAPSAADAVVPPSVAREEQVLIEECEQAEPAAVAELPQAAAAAAAPVVPAAPAAPAAPAVTVAPAAPAAPAVPAKFAAAAEALRGFRLQVPAMQASAPVAPGSLTRPAPAQRADRRTGSVTAPAAMPAVVPAPADAPAAAAVAPPRVFARTSTIPRRPATAAPEPVTMLPEVDGNSLLRASEALGRLSRRFRGPNVG